MDKDWPQDPQAYNRQDADLSQKDPADLDENADNDIERRDTLSGIIDSVTPTPPVPRSVQRNEAIYGDTDMNPNADDVRDEHAGTPDEIV